MAGKLALRRPMPDTPTARKPWTVLSYTVAEDPSHPLDTGAAKELRALCESADFTRLSIAAQVDFEKTSGVFRGTLTTAAKRTRGFKAVHDEDHRLWRQILGGVDTDSAKLAVQREARDLNSAKGRVLRQFLRYGQKECPADRYVMFFYGHAAGPFGMFNDAEEGQDFESLQLGDLAGSLESTERRADILVFRDCFMNTLETAYQLRESARFMIATQSLAPAKGIWPFTRFMEALVADADSRDIGLALVTELAEFFKDPGNRETFDDVPYSLIDLGAAGDIEEALKALTDALVAARDDPEQARACADALERARVGSPVSSSDPGDPALLDVRTMCDNLVKKGGPVAAPAEALGALVRDRLVLDHHSQKKNRHRGMAVFYKPVKQRDIDESFLQANDPDVAAKDAAAYEKLGLCQKTGWHRIALKPFEP